MKRKSTKRVSLSISRETKAMLDSVKHTGQSKAKPEPKPEVQTAEKKSGEATEK